MRSPLWFVLAGAIALAGIAGAILYVVPRVGTLDKGVSRVVVPGSSVLVLDKPGRYTIYHERPSVVDGRHYDSDKIDGLRITLTEETTGAPIALVEPTMSSSYSIGNRRGISLLTFAVEQPGRYRLAATLAGGGSEPKAVLAVEQGMVGAIFRLVFGALAIVFVGLGLAGALVLVVVWRRSKAA